MCKSEKSYDLSIVMDIPLYNELNLQKGNHIAMLSHL